MPKKPHPAAAMNSHLQEAEKLLGVADAYLRDGAMHTAADRLIEAAHQIRLGAAVRDLAFGAAVIPEHLEEANLLAHLAARIAARHAQRRAG